jgi:hypothetical protein
VRSGRVSCALSIRQVALAPDGGDTAIHLLGSMSIRLLGSAGMRRMLMPPGLGRGYLKLSSGRRRPDGPTNPATARVAVSDFATGSTPNGLFQMTGNVWEWLADSVTFLPSHKGGAVQSDSTLRRIIGGAFDTYLHSEASTRFVTGQQEFDRRANIGFRLVVPLDRLRRSQGADSTH